MTTDPIKNAREPQDLLHSVLSDLANTGIKHLLKWLREPVDASRAVNTKPATERAGTSEAEAAALLGVDVDATEKEVRAAFRASVRAHLAQGGNFHDQGGVAKEDRAERLIEAKRVLLQRIGGAHS